MSLKKKMERSRKETVAATALAISRWLVEQSAHAGRKTGPEALRMAATMLKRIATGEDEGPDLADDGEREP